jgi:ribosomal protein S18 acetylase RimI-like enzyme
LATIEDAPTVGRLLYDFNTEFRDPSPEPEWMADRVVALMRLDTSVLVVAEPPAGLALLRFRPSLWSSNLECYLAELYIVPDRRGQGLGRALLTGAIEHAKSRGADYMDLTTTEADVAARGLYESVGFDCHEGRADGSLSFYYELSID